ncbi:MAG: ABC transporter ATP-binding protein [Methanobacterium sp.]
MMNLLWQFIKDLYNFSRSKLLVNILFMIVSSLTSGMGILMLIPLLSITGITGDASIRIAFLDNAFSYLNEFSQSMQLIIVLLIYISLIVFQAAMNRRLAILNAGLVQGYTKYLRDHLYAGILQADWALLAGKRQTDITNAFTMEINRVSSGTIFLLRICSQFILAAVQLYIAFLMSPALTAFVLICGSLIFLFMNSTLKESKKLGSAMQRMNRELMSRITEQLSSIKESKIYGVEREQEEKFLDLTSSIEKNMTDFIRLQSRPDFLYKIAAAFVISVFFYFTVNYLKVAPAAMLIIIFIFARLWPIFSSFQNDLQNIYVMIPSYLSLKQLKQELNEQSENINIKKNDEKTNMLEIQKAISLENVRFAYQENMPGFTLQDINIDIPAYSITALVGKSGAGKSTMVNLLLGLLKPGAGIIRVDDTVLDGSTMSDWRKVISYVPQDPFLLNDTIRENLLRFNPGASQSDFWEALEMAAASEFVRRLPQGIDTVIGDRGVRLSGGERQRIVLARALIKKPQLLVLDEATSALDMENESKIQQAIETMRGKLTIIIIAHRMATIHNADKIIVLDAGRIIEKTQGDGSAVSEIENDTAEPSPCVLEE